ncbi:UDP-glycosyltransferase 13-like [Hibiscus syriacus]|uniref:UDP-glycosyltransferase 13-like n=1 Tax=Hibiscus syriacus TaxID=106335 RepID=UPI001923F5CF|nr:UDP-glycosyltransferase 13-like [Hibiscus syriacus]
MVDQIVERLSGLNFTNIPGAEISEGAMVQPTSKLVITPRYLQGYIEGPLATKVQATITDPQNNLEEYCIPKFDEEDKTNRKRSDGVLMNSFEGLEKETLDMLSTKGLPPVFPLGPLLPLEFVGGSSFAPLEWLENQREISVVYVSFGSRTPMCKEQIRELGNGLVLSGYKFLWAVKSKVVDKEEKSGDLDEIIGHQVMNKVKNKNGGGGSLEWDPSAWLASTRRPNDQWGDDKGSWVGDLHVELGMGLNNNHLVKGEEIGDKIKELMENQMVRTEAARISE